MKQTITITRGLPASGKSTWANEIVRDPASNTKRINKDDLRKMIHANVWSKETEHAIVAARNTLIQTFLRLGHNVIVDDTNIETKHIADIFHLVACEFPNVEIEVKDFDDNVEDCIENDLHRDAKVGEQVIRSMDKRYNRNALGDWKKLYNFKYGEDFVVRNEHLTKDIFIVDIDGTIAHMSDERHPFDWDNVDLDLPNQNVIDLIQHIATGSASVIFMSGRDEAARQKTEAWLRVVFPHWFFQFGNGALLMRSAGDMRKDYIVKRELFEAHIRDRFNVIGVFDDRDQVVHMWRKQLGLTVFQVAEGNF